MLEREINLLAGTNNDPLQPKKPTDAWLSNEAFASSERFGERAEQYSHVPGLLDEMVYEFQIPVVQVNASNGQQSERMIDHLKHWTVPVRVGFFGLCTLATPFLSFPESYCRFVNLEETAKSSVKKLKELNCDVIVAMTHLDCESDRK